MLEDSAEEGFLLMERKESFDFLDFQSSLKTFWQERIYKN
jgi:hypothetical protein